MWFAAFLDVDGTLIDSNYLHVEAWARALAHVGVNVPRVALHREIGKGSDQLLPQFVDDPDRARRADRRHSKIYDRIKRYGQPLPGARELLTALDRSRCQVWLATSARPEEIARNLKILDAEDRIAGVISSQDVAKSKPAPDLFLRALDEARVPLEEAVVIGDTLWDVLAARAAGLACIAVLTGGAWRADELRAAGARAVYADCRALLAAGFPRLLDEERDEDRPLPP